MENANDLWRRVLPDEESQAVAAVGPAAPLKISMADKIQVWLEGAQLFGKRLLGALMAMAYMAIGWSGRGLYDEFYMPAQFSGAQEALDRQGLHKASARLGEIWVSCSNKSKTPDACKSLFYLGPDRDVVQLIANGGRGQ